MKVLVFATALLLPTLSHADEFHLACDGQGSRVRSTTTFGNAFDNHGNSAFGTATTQFRDAEPDRLVIEIEDGAGRIRVPPTIIPPLHGGGQDGWWTLKNIEVTDDEISGQFALNFINQPTFHVDRRTGDISMSGFRNGFNGTCEKFDPAPEARKF